MNDLVLVGLLSALAGLAVGGLVVLTVMLNRAGRASAEQSRLTTTIENLETSLAETEGERDAFRDDAEAVETRLGDLSREHARLSERLAGEQRAFAEREKAFAEAEERMTNAFRATGAKALEHNNQMFLDLAKTQFKAVLGEASADAEKRRVAIDELVKPVHELLNKQAEAVNQLEQKRAVAYRGIEEQIKHIAEENARLRGETGRLVTALRRPEQRGRWGEIQLERVVELAGMQEHCDFHTQPMTDDPETRDRPDMIVRLPGEGVIVVDSKVALDAYLDALSAETPEDRELCMMRHAKHVEKHYQRLADKGYWDQFERTPKLVVLFMPIESALAAALDRIPDLHAHAMQRHVLISTPTLLVALLRAIAYGWQQESIASNARAIAAEGRTLYERLSVFADHLGKAGRSLGQATKQYNQAVGSLERSVLPSARKMKELGAVDSGRPDIDPAVIETDVRAITASELFPLKED